MGEGSSLTSWEVKTYTLVTCLASSKAMRNPALISCHTDKVGLRQDRGLSSSILGYAKEARMAHYKKLLSPQRVTDPDIVHRLERVKKRLAYAIEEYQDAETPNTSVDFNIVQAIHALKALRRDLDS